MMDEKSKSKGVDYILSQRKKGASNTGIKKALFDAGWSEEDLSILLKEIDGSTNPQDPITPKEAGPIYSETATSSSSVETAKNQYPEQGKIIEPGFDQVSGGSNSIKYIFIASTILVFIGGGFLLFAFQGGGEERDTKAGTEELLENESDGETGNDELTDTEIDSKGSSTDERDYETGNDEPVADIELSDCYAFPDRLDACEPFSCVFEHPLTGEMMKREIFRLVEGRCQYSEEMPNSALVECEYTESMRKAVAQYHRDLADSESSGTSITGQGGSDGEAVYIIDGVEVENPLQEAMYAGECVISGLEPSHTEVQQRFSNMNGDVSSPDDSNHMVGVNLDLESECPPGTDYMGITYDEDGEGIFRAICRNSDFSCPPCENCVSGYSTEVNVAHGDESGYICQECSSISDCKIGYHCFNGSCISNIFLTDLISCSHNDGSFENDPCQQHFCEGCELGYLFCYFGRTNWDSDIRDRCVECRTSGDCIEGYRCEAYECIL